MERHEERIAPPPAIKADPEAPPSTEPDGPLQAARAVGRLMCRRHTPAHQAAATRPPPPPPPPPRTVHPVEDGPYAEEGPPTGPELFFLPL